MVLYVLPQTLGAMPLQYERRTTMTDDWKFSHNRASEAEWGPGRRKIFDYRDLGIREATNGDYQAQVIRTNGRNEPDDVQRWQLQSVRFQV